MNAAVAAKISAAARRVLFPFSEIELNQRDNSSVVVKIFAFWQFRKKANKYVDQSEESRHDLVNHGRGSN